MRVLTAASALALIATWPASIKGQIAGEATRTPSVELYDAPTVQLTGDVDSNSPATWARVDGRETLFVMTSTGLPSTAAGSDLGHMGKPVPIHLDPWPGAH